MTGVILCRFFLKSEGFFHKENEISCISSAQFQWSIFSMLPGKNLLLTYTCSLCDLTSHLPYRIFSLFLNASKAIWIYMSVRISVLIFFPFSQRIYQAYSSYNFLAFSGYMPKVNVACKIPTSKPNSWSS